MQPFLLAISRKLKLGPDSYLSFFMSGEHHLPSRGWPGRDYRSKIVSQ
jgi:hypothetical protein